MSFIRRWGLRAFLLVLPALALPCGAARAADDNPGPKAADAGVREALKSVINEGADMYNGQGKYTERDYLGCYHLYEGALITIRPLLAGHADLQKVIDDGLDNARNTPRPEMRAFVLRDVIDKIREGVKSDKAVGTPKPSPPGSSLWDRLGGEAGVSKVVDDFVAAAATDPKVDFTRGGKYKLNDAGVAHLKKELIDFVSSATGGPFEYKGKSMKDAHKGMGITDAEFDASAADLKAALVKNGVKPDDVKAVLGAVETTRKDIVEGAAPPPPPPPVPDLKEAKGKVKSVEKDKIVITDAKEKDWELALAPDAKVTIDGKEGKAEDIKKGSEVIVFLKDGKVTEIKAIGGAAPPPPPPAETKTSGKVLKVVGKKLTVLPATGEAKDFTIPDDAKVSIDGKDGKLDDVKVDSTVTVTDADGKVTKIDVKTPATPPPGQTLWDRLGGEANVAKVVDDFVNAAAKDPKVNFFRDPTYQPSKEQVAALKTKLVEFVSSATGGPLKYTGKDMKEAHKGMKITDAEFDAIAVDLKAALEKNGAKADNVKAVLDAVEGTRKDIVEVKGTGDKPKPPDGKQADTGNVSGKVTYKGQPFTNGVVTLTSADGKSYPTSIAADGTYSLKDVKVGAYIVTVGPDKLNIPIPGPFKYRDVKTSPLKVEVQKGDQTADFQLAD